MKVDQLTLSVTGSSQSYSLLKVMFYHIVIVIIPEVGDESVSKRWKHDTEEKQSRKTRDMSHERPELKRRIVEVRDVDVFYFLVST